MNNLHNTDTGSKVFRILKILSEKDVSLDELLEDLYLYSKKDCSYETVQKYINTLKYSGLNISKIQENGKFRLLNSPCTVQLSGEELETLSFLEVYVNSLHNPKLINQFSQFLNTLGKYFSEDLKEEYRIKKENRKSSLKYDYSRLGILTHIFENYCLDNQKLEIEYRVSEVKTEVFVIEPKEILYEKNMVYLLGYCPESASNKKLLICDIISYKQLPGKINGNKFLNTVVFECRGRLGKNYKLKQSERIINSDNDCVIVSNAQEDREVLLRRILKYGENAKVVQPKNLTLKMVDIIDKMIENLKEDNNEENSDNTDR